MRLSAKMLNSRLPKSKKNSVPPADTKKHSSFRSLTVTLAIAFLTLIIVILFIEGGLQMYLNFQGQNKIVADQQRFIAQDAANTVRSFIQTKFNALEAVVQLSNLAVASPEEQKLILENLLGFESLFRDLLLLDQEQQELATAHRLSRQAAGRLINRVDDALFDSIRQGERYISPVYIDELTSEPLIIMAIPATDVFGDVKGALIAEVNLKFLWDLVGTLEIGKTGSAYVVDEEGNLIAFDDISRILKGENLIHLNEVDKFLNRKRGLGSDAEVSNGIQGTSVVSTYVPLDFPDWAVVVELPVAEAYKEVIQRLLFSVATLLLSVLMALVIGIYLSKRITKPIIKLRDAAITIGKGELDTKIEINTKDEIAELASSLNQMAQDIRDSRKALEQSNKNLEKLVAKRTKELESKVKELGQFNKVAVGRELRMIDLKKKIKELEALLEKKE